MRCTRQPRAADAALNGDALPSARRRREVRRRRVKDAHSRVSADCRDAGELRSLRGLPGAEGAANGDLEPRVLCEYG